MPAYPNAFFQSDPMYLCIMGPVMLMMMFAQWWVKSTFDKWDKVPAQNGFLGADVATKLLNTHNMSNVTVSPVEGELTDHYDPMKNALALSQATYNDRSIAAQAVVAHEVGHALQDANNSILMKARIGIVPLVNIGSQLGPVLFLAGFFGDIPILTWIGIILFSTAFLFAALTLPVELDASNKALKMMEADGFITTPQEKQGAQAVLRAAAFTYIAGMATALFQLIYYISLALRGRNWNNRAG